MNVCFLSREYPPRINGGVGVYIYEMARTLVELGHTAHVITEACGGEGENIEDGVYVYRVKPVKLPVFLFIRNKLAETFERLEYSFAVSKKLSQIVKKKQIDVVESTDARAEGLWYYFFHKNPALLIKLHTPESIIFDWNNSLRSLDFSILKTIEEFWIMKAGKLLCISAEMPHVLSKYYKFDFHGIIQQPNPVDVDLFKPDWNSENGRDPIILYVGRLEFRKGVHVFIRAIPEILKEFPGARFIFIGKDDGIKPYLLRKIKEFDCEKNTVFFDYLPHNALPGYYQKSSLCVIPSLWENFPYTCLEAMACGRPVVASCVGGITEIVENGINGVLVPPGSVKELAQAIIEVLRNKTFADKLGKAASELINEKFNRFKIVEESIKIYQGLDV